MGKVSEKSLFSISKLYWKVYGDLRYIVTLNSCLPVSSAGNFCKQFGTRPGPTFSTKCQARSGYKLFDTLMVLLKEFFEKVYFEKIQQTTNINAKLTSMQSLKNVLNFR